MKLRTISDRLGKAEQFEAKKHSTPFVVIYGTGVNELLCIQNNLALLMGC